MIQIERKSFPNSPAIDNIRLIQDDPNVRISDLLEDNESITSYDDFDNNQQINGTYSSSSSSTSSSSLTITSNETLDANKKQSSESLCYIDEIDSLIIQSSNRSTSNSSSSSASLTSLNQTTTITNLTICTNSNLPFLNKVNERLLNFVNTTKQPDETEMKQFIYYYDDLLDLEHFKQNDNISVYKSNKKSFNLNSRAPLASSETTTLSGSQTHLNSFTIIKRIKL